MYMHNLYYEAWYILEEYVSIMLINDMVLDFSTYLRPARLTTEELYSNYITQDPGPSKHTILYFK